MLYKYCECIKMQKCRNKLSGIPLCCDVTNLQSPQARPTFFVVVVVVILTLLTTQQRSEKRLININERHKT